MLRQTPRILDKPTGLNSDVERKPSPNATPFLQRIEAEPLFVAAYERMEFVGLYQMRGTLRILPSSNRWHFSPAVTIRARIILM